MIGPQKFSEYMREALYGEQGFYTLGRGAGRTRDFLTSPEVGDLFGYVIAGYIDNWCDRLDVGSTATVLEVGCGPGSLAASIARAQMRNGGYINYEMVDISPAHREQAEQKMNRAQPVFTYRVLENIPECEGPTLLIANELLDNLIFDIAYTHDIYKNFEPDKLENVSDAMSYFGHFANIDILNSANVPLDIANFRVPVHVGIAEWLEELAVATAGVNDLTLLIFDYMKSVVDMDDGKWMRMYANNERIVGIDNVLEAIAENKSGDITTDVIKEDLHLLLDSMGYSRIKMTTQHDWLIENAIDGFADIVQTTPFIDGYSKLQSFTATTNIQPSVQEGFQFERNTLLDENGLGAFTVLQAQRQV